MIEAVSNLKWDAIKRMEELERSLYWQGTLSRQDLALKLRMSNPQTSTIIKNYLELNPDKMSLNPSTKKYEINDDIDNIFYEPNLTDLTQHADEYNISTLTIIPPSRKFPVEIVRQLTRAMTANKSLDITYHSTKNPNGQLRRITPHTFVSNGKRTHVRAWCHLRQGFRDFIVGRISSADNLGLPGKDFSEDEAWNTLIILKLIPNPELSEDNKKLIEMDFEMENGEKEIRVKQALLYYYFELYNLWPEHKLSDPKKQEVILANPEVTKYL